MKGFTMFSNLDLTAFKKLLGLSLKKHWDFATKTKKILFLSQQIKMMKNAE